MISNFCIYIYNRKLVLYPNGSAKRYGHISLYVALAKSNTIPCGSQIDVMLKFFVYDDIQDKYLTIHGGFRSFFYLTAPRLCFL